MRTKTVLLSALLGALGSVSSVMAQNVYSLNAVGYINVTLQPGFNIITCPLITAPDNTVGTVLNNSTSIYNGCSVYFYQPANGGFSIDTGVPPGGKHNNPADGWQDAGTNVLSPGVACWFDNTSGGVLTATFVGTVPSGPMTNTLGVGFNLVGSVVPVSGDIVTNAISALTNYALGDSIYTFDPTAGGGVGAYTEYTAVGAKHSAPGAYINSASVGWALPGDPIVPNVGQGFWYDNANVTLGWVEDYSVSQ